MKKYLLGLFFALASLSSLAATEVNREPFCRAVGNLAGSVASSKVGGMSQGDFEAALRSLAEELKESGLSEILQNEVVAAAKEAWANPGANPSMRAFEAYKTCLNQKQV